MQQTLFQPKDYLHPKLHLFKQTKLGRIHTTIPWEELEECLPTHLTNKPGPKPWFSNRGMFGLMFLKHLVDTSDEKLIDRFNTDWSLQLFCGKLLAEGEMVRDQAMVSRVRGYLAEHATGKLSSRCFWSTGKRIWILLTFCLWMLPVMRVTFAFPQT